MKTGFMFCAAMCVLALCSLSSLALRAEDADALSDKYFTLVGSEKAEDQESAKKIGDTFLTEAKDDADKLNEFAWKIMTDDGIKKRDLDLAMKVAKAAFDKCEGKSAAIVDTYAHAFFDTGKTEEAIKWQKKAVELGDDDELKETLKKYEAKAAKAAETK